MDDRLLESVRISSPCRQAPAYNLLTGVPWDIDRNRWSMIRRNSDGERIEPCLTPRSSVNGEDSWPPIRAELLQSLFQLHKRH